MIKRVPLKISPRQIARTYAETCGPIYGPTDIQRSALMNGIKVAASKVSGALMGACTIMYQAGSRCEVDNELGASHFLRIASAASGKAHSSFAKSHVLQQYGGSLTCTSDRQTIAFTLRFPIPVWPKLKTYLLDTAARCNYHNWEIDDARPLVRNSLHRMNPQQRVMDLVQKACWRGPLTNSIFCEPERIGSISGKILAQFVRKNFQTICCSVASVGIPFEETIKFAEMIEARRERPPEKRTQVSCPRRGYESEDLGPKSTTWIAVAVPGCGFSDLKCLMLHNIVAAACGTGHNQMGEHSTDRVPSSPLGIMAGEDIHTDFKAFNISYQDTGIFGILAKTRACSAYHVALAASEFLTNIGGLSFQQVEVGKLRLKLALALNDEDCVKLSEGLALQAVNNIQIECTADAIDLVHCLQADHVVSTANVLAKKSCDMAYAVVGDTACVPHERELIRSSICG